MVRVFLVTDIRFQGEGLAAALIRDGRLEVAGIATRADASMRRITESAPAVVLLDARMPGGPRTARRIAEECSGIQTVALGLADDDEALRWAQAGVGGWVHRDSSLEELVADVECAAAGELRCSGKLTAALLRRLAAVAASWDSDPRSGHLTRRELDVLRLLTEGLSNKEIAGRLVMSSATAKNHVHHLLGKLGVHSRAQAAARGRRLGLV